MTHRCRARKTFELHVKEIALQTRIRLKKYYGDSHFFARERAQRKPVVMLDSDGEELHVVDGIVERRLLRTPCERGSASAAPCYEYRVRWLDHGRGKDKWESDELAKDPLTAEMVRRFNVKQDAADAADGTRAQSGARRMAPPGGRKSARADGRRRRRQRWRPRRRRGQRRHRSCRPGRLLGRHQGWRARPRETEGE